MSDRSDQAQAVLAQHQHMQWLLCGDETSSSLLMPRALCIPPASQQQQCTQAAAAVLCQAGCKLPEDPALAVLLSSRSGAAAQLLQLYAGASGDVLLDSICKNAQLLQLGLQQANDSHQHIPGQVPAAALLTQPLAPVPAALLQPHVPGCLSCLVPPQAPDMAGTSPSSNPAPSAPPAPVAAGAGLATSSPVAAEAVGMEGIEEGGAQDQVSDADTLEQLCTSLQAAATSMDVGGVSIALLLQQLGAAAAVGSVPQALQQQLCRLPEGIVQLLLQQAAAASVQPGAGAVGAGVAALLAASLLPLLLGMEAAGSPTLLACLVTAVELDQAALVAGVLVPLLAAPQLKLGHIQLLVKLLKEQPAAGPGLLSALQQAVTGPVAPAPLVPAAPAMAGGGVWQEPHIHLLQALVDACPGELLPATPAVLRSLQAALAAPGSAQGLQRSVKLVQLLKSLVVKSSLSPADLQVLEQVVGSTQTFLTKGLLAQVRRLQAAEGS